MAGAAIEGLAEGSAVVGDVRLHFRVGGEPGGPPVVLIHGWGGTSYSWRHVVPTLLEAGCAVLVPDLRGYGDSGKPSGTAGYDGVAMAADARGLVSRLGFGHGAPVLVAAHDMGAPGALLWAGRHPEEVSTLVYIEEPVLRPAVLRDLVVYDERAEGAGSLWWWLFALAPGAAERLVVGREREYLTWFYERSPASARATREAVDEYLRTFRGREGVLGALGVYRAVPVTAAQTEELARSRVRVPLVGVGGAESRGLHVAAYLSEVADEVEPVVLQGGHFLPEEQPAALAEVILGRVHAHARGGL